MNSVHLFFHTENTELIDLSLSLKVIFLKRDCFVVTSVMDDMCPREDHVTFLLSVVLDPLLLFYEARLKHSWAMFLLNTQSSHFFLCCLWDFMTCSHYSGIVTLSLLSALLVQGPEPCLCPCILHTCITFFYGAKDVFCTLSGVDARLFWEIGPSPKTVTSWS